MDINLQIAATKRMKTNGIENIESNSPIICKDEVQMSNNAQSGTNKQILSQQSFAEYYESNNVNTKGNSQQQVKEEKV